MRLVKLPWYTRLQDWWRCSFCGGRFGRHNSNYEIARGAIR